MLKLGEKIKSLRKQKNISQEVFANYLGVSFQAVSKWERGESVPDVVTMMAIAEHLGVTVNDLLVDPNALPEDPGPMEKTMERMVQRTLKRKANKNIILGLSSILVWFVALLIFVVVSSLDIPNSWLAFFYAVPADCIVMLSLRSAWRDFRWNRALISGIMWGALAAIYATLLVLVHVNIWKVFLLGIPGQIAILLWFKLFRSSGKEEDDG